MVNKHYAVYKNTMVNVGLELGYVREDIALQLENQKGAGERKKIRGLSFSFFCDHINFHPEFHPSA